MNLTKNYYLVTEENNSVDARKLNPSEWLAIIRKILKKFKKLIIPAFEYNSEYSEKRKMLKEYLFDFLLPESTSERRKLDPDAQRNAECLPFIVSPEEYCFFARKIMEGEIGNMFLERWIVLTMTGEILLVDLEFERMKKGEKGTFKLGYEEIVKKVSYCLDHEKNRTQFQERLLPNLDRKLAHNIIRHALDIFTFDYYRREREAEEFAEAYRFWQMVLQRIYFPT